MDDNDTFDTVIDTATSKKEICAVVDEDVSDVNTNEDTVKKPQASKQFQATLAVSDFEEPKRNVRNYTRGEMLKAMKSLATPERLVPAPAGRIGSETYKQPQTQYALPDNQPMTQQTEFPNWATEVQMLDDPADLENEIFEEHRVLGTHEWDILDIDTSEQVNDTVDDMEDTNTKEVEDDSTENLQPQQFLQNVLDGKFAVDIQDPVIRAIIEDMKERSLERNDSEINKQAQGQSSSTVQQSKTQETELKFDDVMLERIRQELFIMRNKLEFLVAEELYSKWFSKGDYEPISLLLNSTNVLKSSIENGIKLLTPFISVKRITTKLQKKLTNAEDVKRYLVSIRQFSRDLPVHREPMLHNENAVINIWSDIIQYLDLHQEPAMSDNDVVEHSTVNPTSRFLELLIQCYQLVKDEGSIEKVRKVANGIDVADDIVKVVNGFKMLVNFVFDMEEFPRFDQPLMREETVDGNMLSDGANEDKERSNEDLYTDEDDINEVSTDDLNVATDGDEVKDIDTARLEDELATKEELDVDTQEEGNDL